MALRIVWTPQASKGLDEVITCLKREWTIKEIINLEKNLQSLLGRISKYP